MTSKDLKLEILKIYKTYADQINISSGVSALLHSVKDIKASGNEIETSFRNVLREILPQSLKVSHGHILDKNSNISKQYDVIIADNIGLNSIIKTKDSTEIFLYETIYSIGEIKKTWNVTNFKDTVNSIKDLRNRLDRREIDNKTLLSGNHEIKLEMEISQFPFRNPLFNFVFALQDDKDLGKFRDLYVNNENISFLPNITVILNRGVFVLVDVSAISNDRLKIGLYPEFYKNDSNYEWRFIESDDTGKNFGYLYFLLLEHLTNTLLEKPSYLQYGNTLFDIDIENLLNLDEL